MKAPERIWIMEIHRTEVGMWETRSWTDYTVERNDQSDNPIYVEYIRADVVDEMIEAAIDQFIDDNF
jgi:hypothetical protein